MRESSQRKIAMPKALTPSYRPPTQEQVQTALQEAVDSIMERLKFIGVIPIRPQDILVELYVEAPVRTGLVEIALLRPEQMLPIVVEEKFGGFMLVDGHHRLEAWMEVRPKAIWVVVAKEVHPTRRSR